MRFVGFFPDAGASTSPSRLLQLRLAVLLAIAALAGACAESRSTVTTGPSPAKCQVTLTGASSVDSVGGVGFVTVTTQPECVWNASSSGTWLAGLSPTTGQGSGRIEYRVTANPTATTRDAELVVNDARHRVTQQAAPSNCAFTLAPATQTLAAGGGTGSVAVTTAAGCAWAATSSATWLTLATPAEGTANGTVSFTVAANTGVERLATISVGGQQATVRQSGTQSACQQEITPAGQSFSAAGGSGATVAVTTGPACTWTARTSDSWVTVTGGASGTGNGTVTFSIAANTGSSRTGTITIGSATFTVSQAAPVPPSCGYTIAPTSQSIGAGGGAGNPVTVTAGANCSWTAGSNVSWIAITSGTTGSGNGNVTFTVEPNPATVDRSGTLTIAGDTFTVSQAAAQCAYAINPTSQSIAAAGGAGNPVTVTASGTNCAWTAGSNVNWITITGGASGSGNGTVTFTVAANGVTADRSGTLTIAGLTLTVNQAALPCTYSLSRQAVNAGAGGESGASIRVSAPGGCNWTAASHVSWTVITAGSSGSGDGDVTFYVETNPTTNDRSGTMTIAGQTVAVTQEAACGFTVNPAGASVPATASANLTVSVVPTRPNCNWGAASNAPWLTIVGGATGTGNGTVSYNVAANTGAARTGTLTIANHTFTVNQAAVPCVFSINPTSANQPAGATAGQTVAVTANLPTCSWTAASSAPWLTIAGSGAGTGNGTATYNVAANTSATARTGTLTIAGQTFTVNQAAAACAITLSPTSANVPGVGGSGTVTITANGPQCAWTATSLNLPWLTITGASAGTGNGSITYNVVRNAPTPRTGTITVNLTGSTVGGQNFVVNQAAGPPTP